MIRVALNGYGRIGRFLHRLALQRKDFQVVAINARSEDTEMRAHLLKYDSVHGNIQNDIKAKPEENKIIIDGQEVQCLAVKDASDLPWKEMNIDVVIECTGKAKTIDIASRHLEAGAKKVIVSAPMSDNTPTYVLGVNADQLKKDDNCISNASCTTNCVAPILKLLNEQWGLKSASVSSIHSFTHSQNLLDNSGRDLRRARSAVMSVIPTTTGAVKATAKIIPELEGKIDGMAYRVPIATSSVCDIVVHLEKKVTKEEVNDFFRKIAKDKKYDDVIDVSDAPLVSIDFKTNPHSSIIDTDLTQMVNNHYLKLVAWYDNEWGYINRLADMIQLMAKHI